MKPSLRIRHLGLTLGVLLLDFLSKRFVLANKETFAGGIPLIDGILQFTYVRNAGAAFGMFQGGRWPFVVVSALTVIVLSVVLARGRSRGLRGYAYALILAGAAGNLVDRIFYQGRVVDFILMSWRGSSFPVYNVADMGVSIGASLLVLSMIFDGRRAPQDTEDTGPADPVASAEALDNAQELEP